MSADPDQDIQTMERIDLLEEIRRLRAGIRKHRDSQGHDLCWYHPELWGLLPEETDKKLDPPAWCEFMQKCAEYRASLDKAKPAKKPKAQGFARCHYCGDAVSTLDGTINEHHTTMEIHGQITAVKCYGTGRKA